MRGRVPLAVLLALLAAACGSVAPDVASGPMHRNIGGGYVPPSTTYHGSGGP